MDNKIAWHQIWDAKYGSASEKPHVKAGFDALTEEEYNQIAKTMLGFLDLTSNPDILEVGCGVGSFLYNVENYASISGVDFSKNAVEIIRKKLQGNFHAAEATKLPFPDESFDVVISWSVFFYFPDMQYVEAALNEMLRTLRRKGQILIGDINDIDKQNLYESVRESEHREARKVVEGVTTKHLFFAKSFFESYGQINGLSVRIIDEANLGFNYYSSSQYRFSVLLTRI